MRSLFEKRPVRCHKFYHGVLAAPRQAIVPSLCYVKRMPKQSRKPKSLFQKDDLEKYSITVV